MSHNRNGPSALFYLHPSVLLQRTLITLYAMALIAVLAGAIAVWVKFTLAAILALDLKRQLNNLSIRHDKIGYNAVSASWTCNDEPIDIFKSTVVSTFSIWLHYKSGSARFNTLLIPIDALSSEDFSRLVTKLKITTT